MDMKPPKHEYGLGGHSLDPDVTCHFLGAIYILCLKLHQLLRISHQEEMATNFVSNCFNSDAQPLHYSNTLSDPLLRKTFSTC